MQGWYKEAVEHPPPPSRLALTTMNSERKELYRHVKLKGEPIPVGEPPLSFSVDYSIQEDEEIAWAVLRLCLNRLGFKNASRIPQPVADLCDAGQLA